MFSVAHSRSKETNRCRLICANLTNYPDIEANLSKVGRPLYCGFGLLQRQQQRSARRRARLISSDRVERSRLGQSLLRNIIRHSNCLLVANVVVCYCGCTPLHSRLGCASHKPRILTRVCLSDYSMCKQRMRFGRPDASNFQPTPRNDDVHQLNV